MPNLTKKFTRDSLKRANKIHSSHDDLNKAQIIQTEMARVRAKTLRTHDRNALQRASVRGMPNTDKTRATSPYRSFGLHGSTALAASNTAADSTKDDTQHYNAEILTTMSSLTEPTWAAPSMSMDITSTVSSAHHRKQQQQKQYYQSSNMHNDPATLATNNGVADKLPKIDAGGSNSSSQELEGPVAERHWKTPSTRDRSYTEIRDPPPTMAIPDSVSTEKKIKKSASKIHNDGSKTRRRRTKDSSSSKKRSSSTSSRRSTYSVPVTSLGLEPTPASPTSQKMSRRSKSRSRSQSISTKRCSSVPPVSNHVRQNTDGVVAVKANVQDFEDEYDELSPKQTKGDTITTTPSDEKSNGKDEKYRDAILSTASTTTNEKELFKSHGSVSSKPKSVVEAARMSLRSTLRRTNSNRSISSMQSESISLASSARMVSSSTSGTTPDGNNSRNSMIQHRPTSRAQKLSQDSRIHAIMKDKSRFHNCHEIEKENSFEETHPTIPLIMPKQVEYESSSMDHIRNKNFDHVKTNAFENVRSKQKSSGSVLKYVLWTFPLDILSFILNFVLFLTIRHGRWTSHRKTVLVTGASTAIGAETARQFAMEGAHLALIAPTSQEMEMLCHECKELGSSKVKTYAADLSNNTSAELVLQQAAKDFGGNLDVVIINGENKGHGCFFEEIQQPTDIERMVKDNVLAGILSLHHAMKYIPKTSDSRIVVLSSTTGMIPSPYQSVQSATQHALKGFCDSLRIELNGTYKRRKAPKVCLVSFPEIAGQHYYGTSSTASVNDQMLLMGATLPPMKSYSWAGIPLQHAIHEMMGAISSGRREFGAPRHVRTWSCLSVLAPSWIDWSIKRHVERTHYRPFEEAANGHTHNKRKMMIGSNMTKGRISSSDVQSACNNTLS